MKLPETHPVSVWSIFFCSVLLAVFGFTLNGFAEFEQIAPVNVTPFGLITVASLLSAIVFLGSTLILSKKTGMNLFVDTVEILKDRFNFLNFFGLVLLEEFFARWLFLGVLPAYLSPNPIVFCTLLISGNVLWIIIRSHLKNENNWQAVIPTFLTGFIYAFVFLKFGILPAIFTHLMANSILLLLHKVEDPLPDKDFLILAYSTALSALGFCAFKYLSGKTLNLHEWLAGNGTTESWQIYDYIAVSVSALYGVKAIGTLMMCDQGQVQENGDNVKMPKLWEVAIGFGLLGLIVAGAYLFLGVFSENMVSRALLLTMFVCFFFSPSSGSVQVCNFWTIFPSLCLFLAVFEYAGVLCALAVIGAHLLLRVPVVLIERRHV